MVAYGDYTATPYNMCGLGMSLAGSCGYAYLKLSYNAKERAQEAALLSADEGQELVEKGNTEQS